MVEPAFMPMAGAADGSAPPMTIERDPLFGHWNARCDGCGMVQEVEGRDHADDGTDVVTSDDEATVCAALSSMGWLIRFRVNEGDVQHICPACKGGLRS